MTAYELLAFQKLGSAAIYEMGNKLVDQAVFAYLVQTMDLDTGLIGIRYKVSNPMIALNVSEKSRQGSRSEPKSVSASLVRNTIRRLVDAGLFNRLSSKGEGGYLALRACIKNSTAESVTHNSIKNKVANLSTHSRQPETVINKGSEGSQCSGSSSKVAKYLPTSLPTTNQKQQNTPEVSTGPFAMSLDWQPTSKFKDTINNSYSPCAITVKRIKAAIIDFQLYWATQDLQLTQGAWAAKLFKNDLKLLLTDGTVINRAPKKTINPSSPNPTKPKTHKTPQSVPDRLFGRKLQDWGMRYGFRAVSPGESDDQYRGKLRNHISREGAKLERQAYTGNGVTQ